MVNSCPPDFRQKHEMQLLRHYHEVLSEALAKHHRDAGTPIPVVSFDDVLLQYKHAIVLVLLYMVMAVGSVPASDDEHTAAHQRERVSRYVCRAWFVVWVAFGCVGGHRYPWVTIGQL
eukprot:GFYU01055332.1.p2 GENE.GFYU01055332.1~~GFYU01055332.1.p2  ORF type:complete len:118 (-),score=5.13 GFYU01055332.1:285-638(-)